MKKIYKRKSLHRLAAVICAALTAGTLGFSPVLYAHPILDSKDAAVSISGLNTSDMSINSSLENNVIKWVDFSIGSGEKVTFDTHNYLNYVTGHARSDILGTLTGGGSIYLVNPNGILIGDNATINVGSLYLSTRNLSKEALNAFSTNGTDPLTTGNIGGDVINLGTLNADSVTVEGNNITFKNIADVKDKTGSVDNVKVNLTAGDTLRVGYKETGSFKNPTAPEPTNWTSTNNKAIDWYILVASAADYSRINSGIANKYMLGNDITFEANTQGVTFFQGTFDGLGHTITLPAGAFRPFDEIRAKGVVKNLGIRTENRSKENGSDGALALENHGHIENVWHTGDMTVTINAIPKDKNDKDEWQSRENVLRGGAHVIQ